MQKGDPMELNFEGLEIQKWNIRVRFPSYHVYFQSYGQ